MLSNESKAKLIRFFNGTMTTSDVVKELIPEAPKEVQEAVATLLTVSELIGRYPFSENVDLDKRNSVRTHSIFLAVMAEDLFKDVWGGDQQDNSARGKKGTNFSFNPTDKYLFILGTLLHDCLPEALGEVGHYDINQPDKTYNTPKEDYELLSSRATILAYIVAKQFLGSSDANGEVNVDYLARYTLWNLNMNRVVSNPGDQYAGDIWRSYKGMTLGGKSSVEEILARRAKLLDRDQLAEWLKTFGVPWTKLTTSEDGALAKYLFSFHAVESGHPEQSENYVSTLQASYQRWGIRLKIIDHMDGNLYKGSILEQEKLVNAGLDERKKNCINELRILGRDLNKYKLLTEVMESGQLSLDTKRDSAETKLDMRAIAGALDAMILTCKAYFPGGTVEQRSDAGVEGLIAKYTRLRDEATRLGGGDSSFSSKEVTKLLKKFDPDRLCRIPHKTLIGRSLQHARDTLQDWLSRG